MQNQKFTKKERYEIKKQEKQTVLQKEQKQRKVKRFLFWGGALLLIVFSVWGIVNWAVKIAPDHDNIKSVGEITESDWIRGNTDARVTLIEYGDFQCPACATYHTFLRQLEQNFPEDLKVVYRHFPLRSVHKKAQIAGQAAEAAGIQGKFWEMHDKLYENQDEWVSGNYEELFIGYAQELELDIDKFKIDLESDIVKNKVDYDFTSGQQAGLNSTPSFFVDGTHITNPRNYDAFRQIINEKLVSK